ncbi:MAG: hypothetical protein M1820_010080 [Bogoriella megaspora]|nr:MAG: hypothetical protein M1820_010080 [Bogoriella megaspora]
MKNPRKGPKEGKEIYSQLQRIKNGGRVVRSQKDKEREQLKLRRQASLGSTSRLEEPMTPRAATEEEGHELDNSDLFHNLNNFYRNQLVEAAGGSALGGAFGALSEYGYGSPATLSRVMSMYGSNFGPTRSKDKPSSMREAENEVEGLRLTQDNDEERIIEQMRTKGWDATTSQEQRIAHPDNMDASLASDLRPVSALLRTKRSKRCRNCRHILVRPEPKVASTRYKIRNLALNYLPSLRLRAFTSAPSLINPATHPLTLAARPISTPNSGLATASTTASMISPSTSLDAIAPATPLSLLITLHNPLFDPVKVTLGTPSLTPPLRSNTPASRSRVTILCPQFDIGASGDVWDEALDAGGKDSKEKSIKDATAALEGSSTAQKQAEAGKVWEKGRNWTSVVMEVVPGVIGQSTPTVLGSFGKGGDGGDGGDGEDEDDAQARFMNEDANILEIPLSIRVEYETEAGPGEGAAVGEKASGGLKDRKEQRELTYWCVLGVGRIAET